MLSIQTHYLLVRDLRRSPPQAAPAGQVRVAIVRDLQDALFPQMVRIAREQGVDELWCAQQLDAGAICVMAMADQSPAGMGLLTMREFWIDEIVHSFNPGSDGCYFYATYVSPPWRGRRVQRILDDARAQLAAAASRCWAYAVVEHDNDRSLRSHRASGFRFSSRIDTVSWRGISLASIRRTSSTRPCGSFRHVGHLTLPAFHIARHKISAKIFPQALYSADLIG